ncbi:histidine kinase [Pedobacter sp. HMF7647]|uniref:histidine kinase n=1 Tax=Hufsiella arboris TaxID=2695275 RepID=A0A7K1Y8T7_9SPHI|nr:histidine kinase [Hufsiella arboris]
MKNIFTLFFLLSFFIGEKVFSQPYYFRRYQVENGLSHNTVFCSMQDSDGFMWFGTKDGLNRFDGYSFKTFRYDSEKPGSLSEGPIYSLYSDKKKRLWVGTFNGLYIYNPAKENFSLVKATSRMSISEIHADNAGNLWIICDYHIYRYEIDSHILTKYEFKPFYAVTSFCLSSDNKFWVGSVSGHILNFNPQKKTSKVYDIFQDLDISDAKLVSEITETETGDFLIGTQSQGVKLFNPRNGSVKNIVTYNTSKSKIYVRDIHRFSNHEFWIGSESGIYIYNESTGQVTNLTKQSNDPYSISDNAVYSLYADREGGIWAGTYFGGVCYYSDNYSVFSKYFPRIGANSISGNDVREICQDKYGNLWIGTEDAGLNKLDAKTGLITQFLPDGSKESISYSNIHALMADGDKLWIGTFEHGLDIMDINTGKVIKHYSTDNQPAFHSNFFLTFYKTRDGTILTGTSAGLFKYNPKTDSFSAIPNLPFVFYHSILEDSGGTIWTGTFGYGAFTFKLSDPKPSHYGYEPGKTDGVSNYNVNSIFEDSEKRIWLTTDGGGLDLFNPASKTFKIYTIKNGLPSNLLFKIQEDSDKKLWISSTRGLIKFDPKSEKTKTYRRANGLLTDQFNYNSSYKDAAGRLYFGSVKGMISFDPKQLRETEAKPPVFFTGFQVNNADLPIEKDSPLKKSIALTDTIVLDYNQSTFSIDFAALSFIAPDMNEYAYRMSGLYKDWSYLNTNRKVYFTKLAAGEYVFEVKALMYGSNSWSTKNPTLLIKVLPPIWESKLAYVLYTILFISLIWYLIVSYHKRQIVKNKRLMEIFENKKEKEIYQAKIEFFTNVAHEIRTPLTLIKGPMEKVIKHADENPAIQKNLLIMDKNTDRLLTLTNQLLDFRKTEANGYSLNFVKASITDLLQDVWIGFQAAAEEKEIRYEIELPQKNLLAYIDTEAFTKIISNLLDNGLKYGKSHVILKLLAAQSKSEFFSIQVWSDGKLIPLELHKKIFEPFFRAKETEKKKGTGIGLSISRSLAELHKGSLELIKSAGGFNIFELKLPIHQLIEFNLKGTWKKH